MLRRTCAVVGLLLSSSIAAADLTVTIRQNDGQAMPNAVVYLTANDPAQVMAASPVSDKNAIMDQIDLQFSPHILVVQTNTRVRFPNSDSIKHHVYSFSPAKTFELQLYKGLQANPLLFDKSGIVELGCNVHDWMLAYIRVVDTPYFGKTNAAGQLQLSVPDGDYQITFWHPRISQKETRLSQSLSVPAQQSLTLNLANPLLPDLSQYEQHQGEFSEYE
jgi:plastocyanin